MNVLADSISTANTAEISFAESLLNLAKWLDSQEILCCASDAIKSGVKLCSPFVSRYEWENTMSYVLEENRYYHPKTTNQERVLAVLMLREMILSGDI